MVLEQRGRKSRTASRTVSLECTNTILEVSKMHRLPVRWTSFLYDTSGYADEARNVLQNLDEEKFEIKIIPAGMQQDTLGILDDSSRSRLERLARREDCPNPVNIIWLPGYYFSRASNARANIGRTMFETDKIPAAWVNVCNNMDEVWVPTHFNLETFAAAGVRKDKLFVIPGGVDPDTYSPGSTVMTWPGKKNFNFLSVFEWHYRKGWDVLLNAYLTGFKKTDDVALILKVNLSFTTMERIQREMHQHVNSLGFRSDNIPNVLLINQNYTSKEMAALYAACDAFVLPSRGEGWGRPYIEAMAAGLPTIGSRWSGQTEFMHDENSYLIDIIGFEEFAPGHPELRGHRWAQPSVEHTTALMRQIYENREQAREKGGRARQEIVEKWSWKKAAEKVEHQLERYS